MKESPFAPEVFFDLSHFEHKELFTGVRWVWQALEHLKGYLATLPLGKIEHVETSYAYLVHPELISIGEGTIIEAGAYIRGPCVIGKNCHIRHGAYIRGDVLIGNNCVVGHTTELKHCILLNHARAAHFAFVGDSILGNDVNLGAGTKCANLRLDDQPVQVRHAGELLSTNMRKFGSILGDSVQLGCNVVVNPGTLIGKKSKCFPSLNIGGCIPSDSLIKPAKKMYEIVKE